MTSAPVQLRPWSRGRWWSLVALIFGVQLALIFWLGQTSPLRPLPAANGLTLRLGENASSELLTLRDPTLFVLPHPQEIPATARLKAPQPQLHSFAWPETTKPPLFAADQLGAAINRFVPTNDFLPLLSLARPEPQPTLPGVPSPLLSAGQSMVRLEGALARRELIAPLNLRSWASREILTNSVVQLIVDADGLPHSVTLLSGSGSRDADTHALHLAGAARFEPLSRSPGAPTPHPTAQLSWGRMIFLWHTVPPPRTNSPGLSP
ncbi:MAG TPA: energy transducer TonB [Candidatus Paceibacterota bacterium]|nr:energy transducer TonB [Verrucomicrobiota bacterium]HSA08798.1 energy transducer TonB [Candidatus Paceibacterota bacterium]